MNGYYDRVEAQLRILTERGAHRRSRIPVTPVVAVAASLLVVIAVAGVFVGLRGRAHRSMAPAAPVPVCTSRDWQMRPQTAGRLDEATVAGVSISGSRRCHLRINVAFDLLNRSGALAGAVGAKLDAILPPGVRIERRWAWRNGCEYVPGRYWFRLSGGGKSVRVPVPVPPCIDRRESTGFGLFALPSPNLLSSAGIGPATLGGRFSVTLVRLGYLLGVWGHRVNRGGCGVEWTERMLDGLDLFTGRGLFLGYEYRGRFLATVRGLRVGDPVSRGRQMYGAAFKVSAAQGGSWSAAGLRGYLTTPQNGRIMTIDAGNVGCPAVSP